TLVLNGTGSTTALDTNLQFTGNTYTNGGTLQIVNANGLFNDRPSVKPGGQTVAINSNAVLELDVATTTFVSGATAGIQWPIGAGPAATAGVTFTGFGKLQFNRAGSFTGNFGLDDQSDNNHAVNMALGIGATIDIQAGKVQNGGWQGQ